MDNIYSDLEVHSRAVETLFSVLEKMCEGAISVDRNACVVWINDKYRSLLGVGENEDIIGKPIEEIIPESLMRQVIETGEPVPIDIMSFDDSHLIVSRLPLTDNLGRVMGAVGFVLYDRLDYLQPIISKYEELEKRVSSMEAELIKTRRSQYSIANILGGSPAIISVRKQARDVARSSSSVLILGETGTGKELLAHSIHAASPRSNKPFVAINSAAIPETLLETEFFGSAPGAFTGADKQGRKGKLEIANGGTLFLDEIGDMPILLQAKLLRVIEDKTFEPVGSNTVKKVDIRFVAATSADLEAKVANGEFRQDLFFRLNVLSIHLPPLRDRITDLKILSEALLEQISVANGFSPKDLDKAAVEFLASYNWPGNIREFRSILERASISSSEDDVALGKDLFVDLLPNSSAADQSVKTEHYLSETSLPKMVAKLEREAIMAALEETGGKKAPAARKLGISRSTLYDKITEHNLSDFQT